VPLRDGGGALYHLHQTEESEVKTPEQWAEEVWLIIRKAQAEAVNAYAVGRDERDRVLSAEIDRLKREPVIVSQGIAKHDKAIDPKWHAAALLGFAYRKWHDSASAQGWDEEVGPKMDALRALIDHGKAPPPEPHTPKEMAQLIGQRGDLENKTRKLIRDVLREFGWGKKS
jgi:hypothetical protein